MKPTKLVAFTMFAALDEAAKRGWVVVDMKSEWKTIFSWQNQER